MKHATFAIESLLPWIRAWNWLICWQMSYGLNTLT